MKVSLPVVACTVWVVVLCGCPESQVPPPPASNSALKIAPGTTGPGVSVPMTPLIPADETPTEKPTPAEVGTGDETGFFPPLVSPALGKIAAATVPMPPIEDLVGQVDEYVDRIGKNIEDAETAANYKDDAGLIVRDLHGLALVALAIGLHPEDSKYKRAAPGIIRASMELAAAETLDSAQKGYRALQASLAGEGDPASLAWTKIARLAPVMKAIPNLSSTVQRNTNTEPKMKRFLKNNPQRVYGPYAAMAAIMQGSMANVDETIHPDKVDQWRKACADFRDEAIKANAAAHGYAEGKISYAQYREAYDSMRVSCDESCHQSFYPSAVGKDE